MRIMFQIMIQYTGPEWFRYSAPTYLHLIRLQNDDSLERERCVWLGVWAHRCWLCFHFSKIKIHTKSPFIVVACRVHLEPCQGVGELITFPVVICCVCYIKQQIILMPFDVAVLSYLLVKQCPEHWKWNVQKENLEHHFNLSNEEFLEETEDIFYFLF